MDEYRIVSADKIPTPNLVVYRELVEENIRSIGDFRFQHPGNDRRCRSVIILNYKYVTLHLFLLVFIGGRRPEIRFSPISDL